MQVWHGASLPEDAFEPHLPVLDTHHHLYGQAGDTQLLTMMGVVLLAILLKNITSYVSTLSSSHLSRSCSVAA